MKIKLLLLLSIFAFQSQAQNASKEAWESMFNGKDLTNWTPKIRNSPAGVNYGNTFRVENGKLVVRYDSAAYPNFDERFGHLFYKKKFGYYRIRLNYRFVGEQAIKGPGWAIRNSGIMVHGQTAESMGLKQDFPVSIEVQLLGGNGKDKRTTCNLCTPGTNVEMNGKLFTPHCINSQSETFHGDQWVQAEVLVLGDSLIRHYSNGKEVLAYQRPQVGGGNVSGQDVIFGKSGELIKEGSISLQSESHPVEFKNIEILNLEGCMNPEALNYKTYFVKSKPEDCLFKKKKKK
ncbi:3-keto-disaccharide hydrolase [Aquirufa nivalisilvae]